jgi:hypothetical protein
MSGSDNVLKCQLVFTNYAFTFPRTLPPTTTEAVKISKLAQVGNNQVMDI